MCVRKRVGANLKNYRKLAGFSREWLALECGLQRTYVSSVERCIHNPIVTLLEKPAGPLGVPVARLLDDVQ